MTRQTKFSPLTILIAIFMLASIGPVNASARSHAPTLGVADNGAAMFWDDNYRQLRTRISRKIVPYDFYHHKWDRDNLKQWMDGAKAAGVEPLIAFNHSERHPKRLPSVGAFKNSVRYVRKHYPRLRVISPWNEANHRSQPTKNHPRRAAQYYNATRKLCRHCKIVAADVLDQQNMLPWIRSFRRTATKPKIWGLHSYVDSNHMRSWRKSNTRKFVRAVPGQIWLTEVGGIVALGTRYPYSERRAAQRLRVSLRLALKSQRIKRVYLYSWYGTEQLHRKPYRWDSGLVSADGLRRPGFFALRSWLKAHPAS